MDLATAQEPRTTSQETFVASVRIEKIDKSTRWLTVRSDAGTTFTVAVVPEVKIFDELKVGDRISVRYVESVVVAVRPGTKLQAPTDTTGAAQRGAPSGRGEVVQQTRMVVTIERVDVPEAVGRVPDGGQSEPDAARGGFRSCSTDSRPATSSRSRSRASGRLRSRKGSDHTPAIAFKRCSRLFAEERSRASSMVTQCTSYTLAG